MTKRIIIHEKAGEPAERTVIDYSQIPSNDLISRIKEYEKKYKSYNEFFEDVDCGYSTIEKIDVLDDWKLLLEERTKRVLRGDIKISLNTKPVTLNELLQEMMIAVGSQDKEEILKILRQFEKVGLRYIP